MPKKPKPDPRPLSAILEEYAQVCGEIGDLSYRRDTAIPLAIEELYRRARALNLEADAVKQSTPNSKET